MTSCLLVKAPRQLVAVADGRLSVSDTRRSFETTEKITHFIPRYRIPKIAMSRFSHYSDYLGPSCYVAYAGGYALANEVLKTFGKRIRDRLILVWLDRKPTLSERFLQNSTFMDDYMFAPSDLPEFTPDIIRDQFRAAACERINQFCETRREPADCEFLLFGQTAHRRYYAFKATVDPQWAPGQPVRFCIEEIPDGQLATIGSPLVAGEAYEDAALSAGLEGWRTDQGAIELRNALAGLDLGDVLPASPARDLEPILPVERNWPQAEVRRRFIDLITRTPDPSVGGDLLIAQGGWYGDIELKTLPSLQASAPG